MATEIINTGDSGGGGKVVMAFILGGVMLAVGMVGFFMWDNFKGGGAVQAVPSAIHATVQHK